jgi:hypothetical protein
MAKTFFPQPAYTPCVFQEEAPPLPHINFEHYTNPMVHPVTGKTILSCKKLMNDPASNEVWQTAFGKDFGGMAQGDNKTGQKCTNAIFVMTHDKILHAYRGKKFFTFANPVVDYRPQKDDPNRIRITAMGNLITYNFKLSVRTADINTAKLHWNSVVSMPNAKYMCLHIKFFYFIAALEYFEYMKMPLSLFSKWIVKHYDLTTHAKDGWVYLEMRCTVWGLPQEGTLANKRLRRKLAPSGYYECVNTLGLWYHETQPITFTLVVDDFGVKYVDKAYVDHLVASIKTTYTLTKDWTGNLYCGIKIGWDYDKRTINISMPGYIEKKLEEYEHVVKKKPQHCPYSPEPKQFSSEAQQPLPGNTSPLLDDKGKKRIQNIIGSILYYAQAVDMMVLIALSTIAMLQAKPTEKTMERCVQLLNYLAMHADTKIRFYASDMIMNIHSDASYLLESKACSRACGHFFMGWKPIVGEPIKLNGAFYTNSVILKFVVASAAEAELGAFFHNFQDGIVFHQTLLDMGHPHPKMPVHCNNATAAGIGNNTIKHQQLHSMEMRYFWVGDKVAQDMYTLSWHPGQENLADYQSKHHIGSHHLAVPPWYLHQEDSPRILPRALRPSALKGCVGTPKDGYLCKVPLPRVPRGQSTIPVAATVTFPVHPQDAGYLPDPRIPLYNNLTRLLVDVSKLCLPLRLAG